MFSSIFMTLTCIVWKAGLNTHGLMGRGSRGTACCWSWRSCCSQSHLLLLGLLGLQDVPLFNLLVKLLIVILYILLQVWGQFVHSAEYLSRFFIKLLYTENRQLSISCTVAICFHYYTENSKYFYSYPLNKLRINMVLPIQTWWDLYTFHWSTLYNASALTRSLMKICQIQDIYFYEQRVNNFQ